jgi:DNA polymerase I-like protein with 3'-5' exonuclease and polymerase domains
MLNIFSTTGGALKEYLPNVTEDFSAFVSWFKQHQQDFVAHDLESNMVESILDRVMLVAQFHYDDVTWVIFILELTPEQFAILCDLMRTGKYIIQSAKFEYKLWKKYGVILERFHDTYLQEKILGMGLDNRRNSLQALLKRYLDIDLNKDLQTSFVDNISIHDEQLKYCVYDVLWLHEVKRLQLEEVKEHDKKFQPLIAHTRSPRRGLKKSSWWTHEFIKVLSDMEYRGVQFNGDKWVKLYQAALPLVRQAEADLNAIVARDFYPQAVAAGYIYDKDSPADKLFTSVALKTKMLNIVFPNLKKTAQDQLRLYMSYHDPKWPKDVKPNSKNALYYLTNFDDDEFIIIKYLLAGYTDKVFKLMAALYRDEMIAEGLLIPAGSILINWASADQRMEIFRWIVPKLESTDKEHMEEVAYMHELLAFYLDNYQNTVGLTTKFGLGYLPHINSDGRIRTNIDPVLNTGRISSSKPNILNITRRPEYREAFESAEGYMFVMSDYMSQEMVLTALRSKQQTWIDALTLGHDPHSINAEKIFKSDWHMATENGCEFASDMQKCECKGHKKLRNHAKTVGFGIVYGISKFGLAWKIKESVERSQEVIDGFYESSPKVKEYIDRTGRFSLKHLYTPEAGLGTARFIDPRKVHYDKNGILRSSANFTIQGLGAAVLKVCTVLIRRHVKHMNHDAHIVLTPYDEIIMEVALPIVEYWRVKLPYFMNLAAKLLLNTDLLKADKVIVHNFWKH